MKLIDLHLNSFKGLSFRLQSTGHGVTVRGDNATGKTTLADAFHWLLFGKDSRGRADFDILTLGADGRVIDHRPATVEALLWVPGPGGAASERRLTRTLEQKWTKARGAAVAELVGTTTDFRVDGVPVKKAEFAAAVDALVPEGVFRLLTDPRAFCEHIHWQERRRLLLTICGEVSDAEIIAATPALADLPGILGQRTIEDHRKVLAGRRSEVNRELDRVPVRIDEARRATLAVPPVAPIDGQSLEALRNQRTALQDTLARLKSGSEAAELRRQKAEIDAELTALDSAIRRESDAALNKLRNERAIAESAVTRLERDRADGGRYVAMLDARRAQTIEAIEAKRAEFESIRSTAADATVETDTTCPTCDQPLPADLLEAARARALADANEQRSQRLEAINATGRRMKAELAEIEGEVTRALAASAEADRQLEAARAALAAAGEAVRTQLETVALDTPEMAGLRERSADLARQIAAIADGEADPVARTQGELAEVNRQIAEAEAEIANARAAASAVAQAKQRVEDLAAEETRLVGELERIERELWLCDQFVRAKVSLLTDRINLRFERVRWKLFDQLANGGIQEICEATVDGVPWGSLNNAARINAGLEIIDVLGEFYRATPPIFIDNAESVSELRATRAQQIRLVVQPGAARLVVGELSTEPPTQGLKK